METSICSAAWMREPGLAWRGWWKRTCVAWELQGAVGLRKRRLPTVPDEEEKKSTRAPTRGVEEGVSGPHILLFSLFFFSLFFFLSSRQVGGC